MAVPLARAPGTSTAPPPGGSGVDTGGTQDAARRGKRTAVATFTLPFFVLFTGVTLAPLGYAAYKSLYREEQSGLGFGGTENVFAGLGNYTEALRDPAFLKSLGNMALYCTVYVPVLIVCSLALALLLDSAVARARRFFQVAYFLPHAIPAMIASIIWLYLYLPGMSPVVDALDALGAHWNFLDADTAVVSVVNISAWQWIGYNVIIFYAGLQAVPRETLEAATVDGAGGVRTALQVKVPMIRSTVVLVALFTCIGAIQLFDAPLVVSQRATEMGGDWSPTMYIFQAAFQRHDYGLAAASALLLAVVAGAASYVVTKLGNRWRAA